MSAEGTPPPSSGGAVAVTRGTSLLSELFNRPTYPQSEMLGVVHSRGREEDEATARDSDEEGTEQTEPLSDVEEEDRGREEEDAAMPQLVEDGTAAADVKALRPLVTPDSSDRGNEGSGSVQNDKSKIADLLPLRTPQSAVTQVGSPLSDWASPVSHATVGGSPAQQEVTPRTENVVVDAPVAVSAFRFTSAPPRAGGSSKRQQVRAARKGRQHDLYALNGVFSVEKQFTPLDGYGNTAMLLAARMDDVASLRGMLQEGWEATIKNYYGEGLLHMAVWGNNSACASILPRLVKEDGLPVDSRTVIQRTPLQHAAIQGNTTMMAALLALGADVRAVDANKQTALHLAVAQRRSQAIAMLLERGVNPNAQDNQGNTALHLAAMFNLPLIAASLLSYGASKLSANQDGDIPSDLAEIYGHEMMSRYIQSFDASAAKEEDEEDGKETEEEGSLAKKLAVRLRVGGHDVVYDDVDVVELVYDDAEPLEVQGEHHLEALIPSVA